MASGRANRVRVPGWARVAVSAALIGLLLWMVDARAVGSALAGAGAWWVLVLLAAVYGERIYSAYRWHQVLRWSGVQVPLATVVRISFISSFAGLFLPGVVGTEALRVVGLSRHASLPEAFSSVLVDRLIAIVTLAPLVLVGVAMAPGQLPAGIRVVAWAALALVVAVSWGMLAQWPRRMVEALCPARAWRVVKPRIEPLYAALDSYRSRPLMAAWGLALGLGFQGMRVLVVWASARAVGIDVPAAYYFIFAPIIAFVSMVPVSFAGIGIRDASYVYLFGLVGAQPEAAFAASILVQFTGLLSCLPGGILYAQGNRRQREQVVVEREAEEVALCAHS